MPSYPTLVTGVAGFIGFTLARRLLDGGGSVIGIDSVNDYYDPALKEARLGILRQFKNFTFHKLDLADREGVESIFRDGNFGPVVHLAAQAGVRYSLQNPHAYLDANLAGFLNVLEGCRRRKTEHLVFASSSAVYGSNARLPFSVHDNVDHPISLYAATKKGQRTNGPCLQQPL
jgi:UDP-glucuronate 4-epimerase